MKTRFKSKLFITELLVLHGRVITSIIKCNKRKQIKKSQILTYMVEVDQCQKRNGNYNNQIKSVIHIKYMGHLGLKTIIILGMVQRSLVLFQENKNTWELWQYAPIYPQLKQP
jgi:hypothetical protein